MMNTEFRTLIGMPTLSETLGIESLKQLDARQKRARKNIKYCAQDQWQFVNSWYDCEDQDARLYMLSPNQLFSNIFSESQENIYDEGMVVFGPQVKSMLKDIRLCGNKWLKTVALYYTAMTLEDAFYEVEGTESDAIRIVAELKALKDQIM